MASTLKDVAALAGVSIKTVSNVVHDHPAVAVTTRERVRLAIDALNYHPNLGARHLRKARVGVIALAIPDLRNSYFSDIGDAVIAAAAAHSYTVLIDHTGGERAKEALVANGLRPHLIDGVILSPLALEPADLAPSHVTTPIVLLGERRLGDSCDHVMPDNVAAARIATTHLLSLGRRRIAAIGTQDTPSGETARQRLRGFSQALEAAGLEADPRLLAPSASFHRADGAAAMRRLLALQQPPDAVFCFNDLLGLGALRALREAGYRVPEDVAVAGFDDIEEGLYATPSLTTIAPDKEQIGRLAVSLLLERITGARGGPAVSLQPPFRLIVRESTAGAPMRESTAGAPSAEGGAAPVQSEMR